jgi:DNA-directed RNA polymerase sigma subunit (sigma70/sigma32)
MASSNSFKLEATMERYAEEYLVLQDEFGPKSPESRCIPNSAGSFSLRRARFYSFTEIQKDFVSAEQEYALTKLIKESDPVIKQQMTVQNMRMVVNIAERYTNRGLEFVDLVRAGNQGLIHALEQFEPKSDLCFSTFVDGLICQSIERALLDQYIPINSFKRTTKKPLSFDDATN